MNDQQHDPGPRITGKTKIMGVIGYPVEHSLSPLMHNAALHHLGLDYVYLPFPIAPDNLERAIACFASIGVVGFNVTIPHKQAIIPLLHELSPIAQAIGAVNTVIRVGEKWVGTNTDVAGFIAPLQNTYNQNWHENKALVIGNGGAARAVVAGCIQLGMTEIHLVGRNIEKLKQFEQSWIDSTLADKFTNKLKIHSWEKLPQLIPQSNLLVNTTPIGMYPNIDESPVTENQLHQLPSHAIAYDLIYNPKPTRFLQLAQAQGAIALDGLEMLVQQGAAALKLWLQQENINVEIPIAKMQQVLTSS
ncbi:shikimate dehydrogenase [Cylindrospermopsis raciborskii]|uniref:shikimate dehydrogenase n=1 Tax=Cylindrospermopsis raciborskii TaxID=77022 RepID=UPI000778C160|nr:shikimate dehydrogenase [Cylindrospermopsis raciborskii]MCZ2202113.1 shikimate dehydrogenase [Cylindrospermopsis raciborskii PAMP2012]MCZ2205954.1 shikimate dehydrogenase [Cylindrospermopsis raciborskii PAMP2011]